MLDLPIVKQWAEESEKHCHECQNTSDSTVTKSENHHLAKHVSPKIAILVAQVLAVSLLEPDMKSSRLYFDHGSHDSSRWLGSSLFGRVEFALRSNEPSDCDARDVVAHVKTLLGHGMFNRANETWMASSSKGQVLFPCVYETMELLLAPSLAFYCAPGILSHQDGTYGFKLREVESEDTLKDHYTWPQQRMTIPSSEIDSLSRFSSIQHEWKTRIEGDRMFVQLTTKHFAWNSPKVDPFESLIQAAELWFAASCSHPADKLPNDSIEDYEFIHSDHLLRTVQGDPKKIQVYAVRGNDPLRFAILGTLKGTFGATLPAVIGGNACLSCSLALCRRVERKYLVC